VGSTAAREAIGWMRSLPLYRDLGTFRAVHACWSDPHIAHLEAETLGGVLSEAQVLRAADPEDALFASVETVTKGPELPLPGGHHFHDKDGTPRDKIRVAWWNAAPQTWQEAAISVPDPSSLPGGPAPETAKRFGYSAKAKPVFCGHYWLTGAPVQQAANVMCLDYSAGKDGPLLAYRVQEGSSHEIALANLVTDPSAAPA
jgi:hypothetical protein